MIRKSMTGIVAAAAILALSACHGNMPSNTSTIGSSSTHLSPNDGGGPSGSIRAGGNARSGDDSGGGSR